MNKSLWLLVIINIAWAIFAICLLRGKKVVWQDDWFDEIYDEKEGSVDE